MDRHLEQTMKSLTGKVIQRPLLPQQMNRLPIMKWESFIGQELKVGDLMWFEKDGLAFVDTTLVKLDDGWYPDRITSIPEAWSWSFEMGSTVNSRTRINRDKFDNRRSCITKTGKLMRAKRYGGEHVDTLLYICKMKQPDGK